MKHIDKVDRKRYYIKHDNDYYYQLIFIIEEDFNEKVFIRFNCWSDFNDGNGLRSWNKYRSILPSIKILR